MKSLPFFRLPALPTFCATWASRRVRPVPGTVFPPVFLLILMLTPSGCTLGPTVETRTLLIHPGQPLRVMDQTTVRGERLDGGGIASQDVGGWVMMPPDHWNVVAGALRDYATMQAAKQRAENAPPVVAPDKP